MISRKPIASAHRGWATCPGCFKERRMSLATGLMRPHRMWVSGFTCGDPNCSQDHLYGYMKPCLGSDKAPAPLHSER